MECKAPVGGWQQYFSVSGPALWWNSLICMNEGIVQLIVQFMMEGFCSPDL
jgi:hypothetical protein